MQRRRSLTIEPGKKPETDRINIKGFRRIRVVSLGISFVGRDSLIFRGKVTVNCILEGGWDEPGFDRTKRTIHSEEKKI